MSQGSRIIIINDDGIDAPGIRALHAATRGLGERMVVAPDGPRSGSGHTVTTDAPIPVTTRRDSWYAVGGTPVDCARLALLHIEPQASWVLAGINRGGNLGADIYISGTVAAAREAAFLGYRAIAVSQYVRPDLAIDWEWSQRVCAEVLPAIMDRPQRPGFFWNVNLPHLSPGSPDPQVVFCKVDLRPLDVRFRLEGVLGAPASQAHFNGNYHGRPRDPGRDVAVCFGGQIAVTEVPLDITP
jgi:5'-nucleotidase